MFHGQRPGYLEEDAPTRYKYELVYYLSTYLGQAAPSLTVTNVAKVFFCPGFASYTVNPPVSYLGDRTCYGATNPDYLDDNGVRVLPFRPFGYPPGQSDPKCPPRKVSAVQAARPLSDVYVVVDLDKVAITSQNNVWQKQLPEQPVHSRVRNYLYFDGHVGTKRVGKPKTL